MDPRYRYQSHQHFERAPIRLPIERIQVYHRSQRCFFRCSSVAAGDHAHAMKVARTSNAVMENPALAEGMSVDEKALVQSSWGALINATEPEAKKAQLTAVGVALFEALFAKYPEVLSMFSFRGSDGKPVPDKMAVHALKVAQTLGAVVAGLGDLQGLERVVAALVTRHVKYGVLLAHYDVVLGVLGSLLAQALTAKGLWDEPMGAAWGKVVGFVKDIATETYSTMEGEAEEVAAGAAGESRSMQAARSYRSVARGRAPQ